MNVFEPPIAQLTSAVWLAASASAPSPLPTRRATLTVCPDWLMNVMIEIGSSLPARAVLVVAGRGDRAEAA